MAIEHVLSDEIKVTRYVRNAETFEATEYELYIFGCLLRNISNRQHCTDYEYEMSMRLASGAYDNCINRVLNSDGKLRSTVKLENEVEKLKEYIEAMKVIKKATENEPLPKSRSQWKALIASKETELTEIKEQFETFTRSKNNTGNS